MRKDHFSENIASYIVDLVNIVEKKYKISTLGALDLLEETSYWNLLKSKKTAIALMYDGVEPILGAIEELMKSGAVATIPRN